MNHVPELSFEATVEHELQEIRRDVATLLQAMRILGGALGVKDAIDRLAHSLEHRYPTDPGVAE